MFQKFSLTLLYLGGAFLPQQKQLERAAANYAPVHKIIQKKNNNLKCVKRVELLIGNVYDTTGSDPKFLQGGSAQDIIFLQTFLYDFLIQFYSFRGNQPSRATRK